MIPFFGLMSFHLGPLTIQVWGLCVAAGIVAALLFFSSQAKKKGLNPERVLDISVPVLIGAFVMARVVHVLFYDGAFYRANPGEIVAVWHGGLSSLGGFIGATLGALWFMRRRKLSRADFLPYLDLGVLSLWLGWGIGRIGCFLIHDHPGTLTHFIGGVRYPDGVRHDLGLYESVLGFSLFIVFYAFQDRLTKKGRGVLAAVSILCYGVVRFGLDFLRTIDIRYFGLTPAQWGMGLVVIALTWWLTFGRLRTVSKEK